MRDYSDHPRRVLLDVRHYPHLSGLLLPPQATTLPRCTRALSLLLGPYLTADSRDAQLFASRPAVETDPLLADGAQNGGSESKQSTVATRNKHLVQFFAAVFLVILVGVVAYFVSWHATSDSGSDGHKRVRETWDTKAQVVGWISAFLYLSSRLPQIIKNRETKCQGLSLLMFTFSVLGNTTYVASILLESLASDHLLINAAWLVGSGGTIFLDLIVLGQFIAYSGARHQIERRNSSSRGRSGMLVDDDTPLNEDEAADS